MSKLPNIFHNEEKYVTNNKKSYNTFNNKKEVKNNPVFLDKDNLINYFNKKIVILLKNGNEVTGKLISKRNNQLLLDTKEIISIDDISRIK